MNLLSLTNEIKTNGGVSYSLFYGDIVAKVQNSGKAGFAVSIFKDREIKLPIADLSTQIIKNYCLENSDLFADKDNFLGAWVEAGLVYLDISKLETSKQRALKLAKDNGQLAIFDLTNLETINVQ